jgi:hypothetical protein
MRYLYEVRPLPVEEMRGPSCSHGVYDGARCVMTGNLMECLAIRNEAAAEAYGAPKRVRLAEAPPLITRITDNTVLTNDS